MDKLLEKSRFIPVVLATSALLFPFSQQLIAEENAASDQPLAMIEADLNGDGVEDRAEIIPPAGDEYENGLAIYLGRQDGAYDKAIIARDFVWGTTGPMVGQEPLLEVNRRGSLVVLSQNQAIGRNRWEQRVTIAYRQGRFTVAGYTYFDYDTLDPEAGPTNCDLNLLTGKGVLNDTPLSFPASNLPFEDWDESVAYRLCGLDR